MNYRVRPRDRSNYIERRQPVLNCPATTKRGPRKTQVMKAFFFLPHRTYSLFFFFSLSYFLTLETGNSIARRLVYQIEKSLNKLYLFIVRFILLTWLTEKKQTSLFPIIKSFIDFPILRYPNCFVENRKLRDGMFDRKIVAPRIMLI